MNKGAIIKALMLAVLLSLIAVQAHALDYPHKSPYDCDTCHDVFGSEPSLINEGLTDGPGLDDTKYNWLCWGCHTGIGPGTYVQTHSSEQIDEDYGTWTIECRACHDPHGHYQFRTYGVSSYQYQGTVSTRTPTTVTATTTDITDDYTGYILIPNLAKSYLNYLITGNDTNTVTVQGTIDTSQVSNGDTFVIVRGELIKSSISTPNSGNKAVKYFDATGMNSYADGNVTDYDGVCEVCHTQTTHHRNDGLGPSQSHNDGTDCASCHDHAKGFEVRCNMCHGYPPTTDVASGGPDGLVNDPGVTNSATAGAHDLHVTTKGFTCTDCHFDSAGSGATHNSGLNVTMGFNYFSGAKQGGSYDGQSGVNYDTTATSPVTSVTNTGTLTCSNIYCHGITMDPNGGTDITPQWNDQATGACGTCHGATAAVPPVLGSHTIHAGASDLNLACTLCHSGYTSVHVNNEANVTFSSDTRVSSASYSGTTTMLDAYGSCSSVYCHGSGPSPDWDDIGSLNCGSCHSANNTLPDSHGAHYDDSSLATDTDWNPVNYSSASNYIFTCGVCHNSTAHAGGPVSANQAAEISFHSGTAGSGTHTPGALAGNDNGFNYTSGTCSSTYCHSDGNGGAGNVDPQWGVTTVDCSSCHNSDVTSGSPMASGSHTTHINDADNEVGRDLGCIECHADTVSDNSTIANYANHVNKSKDIKVNIDDTGCSNIQCHSDGNFDGTVSYSDPTWGVDTLGCVNCHGNSTDQAYPSYADGGIGTGASNSHNKHVGSEGISCGECHADTSTAGATIDGTTPTKHVDQTVDVVLQTGTYTGGTETCSSTYCHGTGTPQWGGASFNCDACHKANNTLAGAHSKHYETATAATDRTSGNNSSSSEYIFNCGVCHNSTDHAGGAESVNQAAEISFDTTIAGGSAAHTPGALAGSDNGFNYTDATCSSTYCHGNFPGSGETSNTPTWGTAASGDCGTCHKAKNTQAEVITSGSHERHVGEGSNIFSTIAPQTQYTIESANYPCTMCHSGIVSGNGPDAYTIADTSEHVDMNVDWSFDASSTQLSKYAGVGGVNQYSIGSDSQSPSSGSPRAYGSCTVYCHSIVQTATGGPLTGLTGLPDGRDEFEQRQWGSQTNCYGCHTSYTQAGLTDPQDRDATLKRHKTQTSGSHSIHVFDNLDQNGGDICLTCHNWLNNPNLTVWQNGCSSGSCHQNTLVKTKHVDGNIDIAIKGRMITKTGPPFNRYTQLHSSGASTSYSGGTVPGDNNYGQCSNVYCHTQGTAPRTGNYNYSNATPTWGSSGPGCNLCHGTSTSSGNPDYGMPDYPNDGSVKENSHSVHVSDNSIECNRCHYGALGTDSSTIAPNQNFQHANARYNLSPYITETFNGISIAFSYSQAYTTSAGSCSNISCHGGNNATWGASLGCDDCHLGTSDVDNYVYGTAPMAMINSTEWTFSGHGKPAAQQYKVSGNNGADFSAGVSGNGNQCLYCHDSTVQHDTQNNSDNFFRLKDHTGSKASGWRNQVCLVCHGSAGSGYDPDGVGGTDYANIPSSVKIDKYHAGAKHGAARDGGTFCWDCHDPHGDSDDDFDDPIMMVQSYAARNVDQYGVPEPGGLTSFIVFFNNTVGFGDNGYANNSNDGICQVCHTQTLFYKNDGTGAAHETGVCTGCHEHSGDTTVDEFAFKGSGDCDTCHAYPPQINDGKSYVKVNGSAPGASEGKGGNTVNDDVHMKHVTTIRNERIAKGLGDPGSLDPANDSFGDAKTTILCGTCHDMSAGNHDTDGNGTRLINFNGSDQYEFADSTGPSYNGTPGTSSGTDPKSCSNINCHFGKAVIWQDPATAGD